MNVRPGFFFRDSDRRNLFFWVGFASAVCAAWIMLLAISVQGSWDIDWGSTSALRWLGAICGAGAELPGLPEVFGMWSLMSLAMMGPAAVPFILVYSNMGREGNTRLPRLALPAFAAGYLCVWFGYSGLAAVLQLGLQRLAMVDAGGLAVSPWTVAFFLVMAAGYQLSGMKSACMRKCREPFMFFLSYWRSGIAGAFEMGLRQGVSCLGCCWALMLLAFVGGTMNVLWMAGATLFMLAEKLPVSGDRLRAGITIFLAGGVGAAVLRGLGAI